MSSPSGGCTAVPGQQPCPLARRVFASAASQREHVHVLLALCPSAQDGARPPTASAVVCLRVHSRGHWCKKGWWYSSPPVILKSCTIVLSLTIEKKGHYMPYRGDLTYRLVELQLMLAERPRSQQELVQHFQVNRKTIRKDIDALSRHHPITEERAGRHVMYCFIDGFRFQPPQFTPSELATLLLAQEAIAITGQSTINYHPQSGWFEDAPLKGGAVMV